MNLIKIRNQIIDLDGGRIVDEGQERYLAPRLLALLQFLLNHADEVVSRDQIIESVWGHLDAATDDSVNVAVSALRRELGDTRRPYKVLQAVPRRGYRLVADAIETPTESDVVHQNTKPAQHVSRGWLKPTAAIVSLVSVVVFAAWLVPAPSPSETGPSESVGEPSSAVVGTASESGLPSIVVLPFLDMSPEADYQFFADGLVDRITHMLAQSPELRVVARTSAFEFREKEVGIRQVAERLEVDAVLEGSVQRSADQVRVLAQLIDTETEAHLWSRSFDRSLDDLFEVQDDIANLVSETLTDTLLSDQVAMQPSSQAVQDLIIRASFAMDQSTLDSADQARSYFEQALEIEPNNIEALVGLIDAIGLQRNQRAVPSQTEDVDERDGYLERARAINPDAPIVLRAIGDWHARNRRADEAIDSYRRALSLNANDARTHISLGGALYREARFDESSEVLRQAVRLDPFSSQANVRLADSLWAEGRAEEALFRLRRIIRDQPDDPMAYGRAATYLTQKGDSGEAMRHILRQRQIDPESPARWFRVCEFYLHLAAIDDAIRCADALEQAHDLPMRLPYLRQAIAISQGDLDTQIEQLQVIDAIGNPNPLNRMLLAQALSNRDCSAALDILSASFPFVFESQPTLNAFQLLPARVAIRCLREAGDTLQANVLLDAMESSIERMRIERGAGFVAGAERASFFALKGQYDLALDELDRIVDSGWRYYWWDLEFLPEFQPLRDHPRFMAMLERLKAGVARQREYFEAQRNEPLI